MDITPEMERHLKASSNLKLHKVISLNLVGGFSWGVGSVVGSTVILAIIGYILNLLGIFNVIGTFLNQLGFYF